MPFFAFYLTVFPFLFCFLKGIAYICQINKQFFNN